jgi:hypothetical protein
MVVVVGRCGEDGRGCDEKRPWVLPSASTQPVCAPEKGDDEDYAYENISAMNILIRCMSIQIAITMPVDTVAVR